MLLFYLEFLEAYIDNVLQKIGKLKRVNIKYVSQGMVGIYVYNSCYFKDYVEATNIGGYLDRKTYGIWRSTPKTVVWVRPTVRFPVSILPPAEEIGNVFHGLVKYYTIIQLWLA